MLSLDSVKVTAEQIVSTMNLSNSICLIQKFLHLFHDILCFRLVSLFMEDDVARQDFTKSKGLFVSLDFLHELFEEGQSLLCRGDLLDYDGTYFSQRQKIDPEQKK